MLLYLYERLARVLPAGVESQKKVRAVTTYETCYATAGDDMTSMLRFQVGLEWKRWGCFWMVDKRRVC